VIPLWEQEQQAHEQQEVQKRRQRLMRQLGEPLFRPDVVLRPYLNPNRNPLNPNPNPPNPNHFIQYFANSLAL